MAKPPITITCDCGKTREVAYGERWRCEACGRTWDTSQIPVDEYEGLLRRMRRARLEAVGVAAVLAAILVPLIVLADARFIFIVPVVAAAWLFLYLPAWRRRARGTAHDSPRWDLHPDPE